MQEQVQQQHSPVKIYRTAERLMIAAPMAGLEPENMLVEVTNTPFLQHSLSYPTYRPAGRFRRKITETPVHLYFHYK